MVRTSPCGRDEARSRLAQAESLLMVADLVLGDTSDVATPGVAAALAVLAGVAAADAACCARLKERSRGQDHRQAVALLASVQPHGPEMAKDLDRLLKRKDDAHYGVLFMNRPDAKRLVGYATRMLERAGLVLAA